LKKPALFNFSISTGLDPLPDQQALVALSLGFALAVSPHIEHLPVWLSLATVGIFLWRMWIMRHATAIPGRLLRYGLVIALVFLVYRHYGTVLGRDAGVALLVGLSAMKYLEIRDFRDCMVVVFLSYMIVLTSFLYSQSMLLGGYMLVVVILLTAVMQYLNHSDRSSLHKVLKNSALLVGLAMPLGLVLFLLFPRVPIGLFGLPGDSHAGMIGMSDVVRPGSINQLNENDDIAFRADIDGKVPSMQQRYWRGIVLGEYRDNAWRKHKRYLQTLRMPVPEHDEENIVNYSILLEPSNERWVFSLDLPIKKPSTLYWGRGQTLMTTTPMVERTRYDMSSAPGARFNSLSEAEHERYTAIPEIVKASLQDIAADLYGQSRDTRSYIDNVLEFFRSEGFTYTLQPPLLGNDTPMRQFLLETRKGYCEHYASAFTLLMRVAGVPSRLVAGYQGGEWNPQGEYITVRQSDAHAWTEVWLDELGWVRIDPTAVVAPERIEYGLEALRLLAEQGTTLGSLNNEQIRAAIARPALQMLWNRTLWFLDDINTSWYLWVIGYGKDEQESLLKRLGLGSLTGTGLLITAFVTIMLIAVVQGMLLLRRRGRRQEPAVFWYKRFCSRLEEMGQIRGQSEGPRDFGLRAAQALPGYGSQITRITSMYVNIHYADKKEDTAILRFKQAVKSFTGGRLGRRAEQKGGKPDA
jgi:transglutaminase-like putative cysteine protease